MHSFVSLSGLFWSTPDGTPLFSNLNLTFGPERTGIVGRNGIGKSTLLRLIAGDLRPTFGQIRAAGSLAMMRQDSMEHPSKSVADLLGVTEALDLLDRAGSGLATAAELAETDWMLPARIYEVLDKCGLSVEPQTLLATLSGGQRTRAAVAALILAEPSFVLLDEPTNNLDQEGRKAIIELIRNWKGGAIIASHDQELLEEMDAIVELTSLGATRFAGNYTAFRQWKDTELKAAAHDLAQAEKARSEAARRAQEAAERKARKDSAGRRGRAKGDQSKIVLNAARSRAEASGGAGARLRESRRNAVEAALSTAREKIEVLQPLSMELAPTGLPASKTVLRLYHVTGGHDPERPVIRDLSLTVTGPERIVIAGSNGSGKTTLLKLITGQLKPQSGQIDLSVPFALLDQHVGLLAPSQTLRENFLMMNPAATTLMAHAALARFGFRAGDSLRRAGDLSGGERTRAGLCCTLGGTPPPMLLMLDEPTNHLDLDGIEALKAALVAYDGAVLLVSHDRSFVRSIGPHRVFQLQR